MLSGAERKFVEAALKSADTIKKTMSPDVAHVMAGGLLVGALEWLLSNAKSSEIEASKERASVG